MQLSGKMGFKKTTDAIDWKLSFKIFGIYFLIEIR